MTLKCKTCSYHNDDPRYGRCANCGAVLDDQEFTDWHAMEEHFRAAANGFEVSGAGAANAVIAHFLGETFNRWADLCSRQYKR